MTEIVRRLRELATSEDGASLVEFSLLTGMISLAILVSISAISSDLAVTWSILASLVAQAAG